MFFIRADGNKEIGSGHIVRCLSIAEAIRNKGEEVSFIVADASPRLLLESRNFPYIVLNTNYSDMEAELLMLLPYLKHRMVRGIMIDSYYVTKRYLRKLSRNYTITYIDDRNYVPYPVQNVINYNIYAKKITYQPIINHGNIEVKYLLGCSYVPLRTQFQDVAYHVNEKVLSILITTGGSDKYNIAGKLIDVLMRSGLTATLEIHVVSGVFNDNLPYLMEVARTDTKIHIHQNVENMSTLMQQCDVAITAGGSTMYELCAVGVPSICFSFAKNQKLMVEYFNMRGLALYAGDYQEVEEELIGEIIQLLNYLIENVEDRSTLSNLAKQLVDGYGAQRIAEYLVNA